MAITGNRSLEINDILRPDGLATSISERYREWEMLRNTWLQQKQEIRNYVFAVDTSTTSTNTLPWKNSTHIPKLCQIRDNLHANYMSTLFPNDMYLQWEGDDESSDSKDKRLAVQNYMANKLRASKFQTEMSKCVYDWIDYGNAFAMTEFVAEYNTDAQTGEKIAGYVGPRMVRVSPLDLVFNPVSASFEQSPKIRRVLTTIGSLHSEIGDHPESGYLQEVFDMVVGYRQRFNGLSIGDFSKNNSFVMDGFSSFLHYFQSDYVELLEFYGDIYDVNKKEFKKNRLITVVDRCHIIRDIENPSWIGQSNIFHVGWRLRPDNLYAMGPLDNLVGMQYRIDHLENSKADAFDLIIQPVQKIKGYVEDYEYGPGERIFCGDEGDVEFMRPDTTMLNADTQIQIYEQKMEEMAGAPKQAMGFRTPGEKTAYEVQVLENGANRVFLNKTGYLEEVFMEPVVNSMLEIARRNMGPSDVIRVMDDQFGVANFMKITREDITARGKIRPIGARHYARNANIVQNLTQLMSSAIGQDPSVNAHISGKKLAYLMEELLGLERFEFVQDNIRIAEQMETQQLAHAAQQIVMEQNAPDSPQQQGQQAQAQGSVVSAPPARQARPVQAVGPGMPQST